MKTPLINYIRTKITPQLNHSYFRDTPQRLDEFKRVKFKDVEDIFKQNLIGFKERKVNNKEFLKVYNGSVIEPVVFFFRGTEIGTVGSFSYSHSPLPHGVSVGRYCSIASDIRVFGGRHYPNWISTSSQFYDPSIYGKEEKNLTFEDRLKFKINIGNDVWIGSHVALNHNIIIGDGSIIATGAVVTKNVPPFSIVAGVPAKVIKFRFSHRVVKRIQNIQWWRYHVKDIKPLQCNHPERFLDNLENKIAMNDISEYTPNKLVMDDILQLTPRY